jgi:hypothetical protein
MMGGSVVFSGIQESDIVGLAQIPHQIVYELLGGKALDNSILRGGELRKSRGKASLSAVSSVASL